MHPTRSPTPGIYVPGIYVFDFFGTLAHPGHESIRQIARDAFAAGHEVHILSAISPGLPWDYEGELKKLNVPFTKIHRVDHIPAEKVRVLAELGAWAFWDDSLQYVEAARIAGFATCHAGVDPAMRLIPPYTKHLSRRR